MIHYHFRITEATRRNFAHHELTQNEIDCRFIDGLTVSQRLQPSFHLIDSMDILETYGTSGFVESPSESAPSTAPSLP